MKNLSIRMFSPFAILFLLLNSCSKEETSETPKEPVIVESTQLLNVAIPNNYYHYSEDAQHSGFVYLTDTKGELITKGELKNNTSLKLSEVYDLNANTLNATFILKIEVDGIILYRISTFNDIDPYDLTFIEAPIRIHGQEAIVKLTNTGSHLNFFMPNLSSVSSHTTENSAEYEIGINSVPDNLYFSLQKETEDFRRYVLMNDVTGTTNVSFDYNNLPVINEPLRFNFPENDYVHTSITGANSTAPDNYFAAFTIFNSREGITSQEFYVPQDEFQHYNVFVSFNKDGVLYSSSKKSSIIDLDYSFPTDFDFQFSFDSNSSYNLATSGTSDYYSANFDYFDANSRYAITWKVSGKSDANINFSLPKIEDFIKADFPDFTIDKIKINSAGLSRIQGISSYKQFVLSGADENYSRNNLISSSEYLSKQIDL